MSFLPSAQVQDIPHPLQLAAPQEGFPDFLAFASDLMQATISSPIINRITMSVRFIYSTFLSL